MYIIYKCFIFIFYSNPGYFLAWSTHAQFMLLAINHFSLSTKSIIVGKYVYQLSYKAYLIYSPKYLFDSGFKWKVRMSQMVAQHWGRKILLRPKIEKSSLLIRKQLSMLWYVNSSFVITFESCYFIKRSGLHKIM